MKTIFKKSHLPFLKRTLHGEGTGRDAWGLARLMQDRDGLQHQLPAVLSLLNRGAAAKDVWSACELARQYFFHGGDLLLPEALRLWRIANRSADVGSAWDTQNLPILDRILSYRSHDGDAYADIEMRCAMLTEWHLSHLGLSPFEEQSEAERCARCEALLAAVIPILRIPSVTLTFERGLTFNGGIVDGLAGADNRIKIRAELLGDTERLVEVFFHELGHIVLFTILYCPERSASLRALYGISEERMRTWELGTMGYEVPTSEEDPDTLSYGVYTLWATFFLQSL